MNCYNRIYVSNLFILSIIVHLFREMNEIVIDEEENEEEETTSDSVSVDAALLQSKFASLSSGRLLIGQYSQY